MMEYSDVARVIASMEPGMCYNVPFRDIPEIPSFLCREGRSPIDEILQEVPLASYRIVPSVNQEYRYYRFCLLPSDQWLDPEGDVLTWVYYDRRKYFIQGPDGFWRRDRAAVEARHQQKIAEHLAKRA